MKTTVEVNGYEIVIEEKDGLVTVSAMKDDEVVEEFELETEAGEAGQDDEDVQDFDSFGQDEEEDFEDEDEDSEFEDEDNENGAKLESFQSFINKRK